MNSRLHSVIVCARVRVCACSCTAAKSPLLWQEVSSTKTNLKQTVLSDFLFKIMKPDQVSLRSARERPGSTTVRANFKDVGPPVHFAWPGPAGCLTFLGWIWCVFFFFWCPACSSYCWVTTDIQERGRKSKNKIVKLLRLFPGQQKAAVTRRAQIFHFDATGAWKKSRKCLKSKKKAVWHWQKILQIFYNKHK